MGPTMGRLTESPLPGKDCDPGSDVDRAHNGCRAEESHRLLHKAQGCRGSPGGWGAAGAEREPGTGSAWGVRTPSLRVQGQRVAQR